MNYAPHIPVSLALNNTNKKVLIINRNIESAFYPWLVLLISIGLCMNDRLSGYIPALKPGSKFSQVASAVGILGVISGLIWLSIVERRKGNRIWWIGFGRSIMLGVIVLLILLAELGLIKI